MADHAFNINPTNIYGFVLGALVIVIFALCWVIFKLWASLQAEQKEKKEIITNMTTVVLNNTHVIEKITESVNRIPYDLKDLSETFDKQLRATEERIILSRKDK